MFREFDALAGCTSGFLGIIIVLFGIIAIFSESFLLGLFIILIGLFIINAARTTINGK